MKASEEELRYLDELGKRLKAYRKEHGLTQYDAAINGDVTQAAVCWLETGQHNPRLLTLYRIAKAYGCEVKDLL